MALIDKKILNPIRYHQDNSNIILNQASAMKSLFDQGAEDVRVKLNGVIDELLATTGAQQIGIDPARGLGNTLADALTNIKNYMNLGASGISATTIGTGSGNTVQSQLEWLLLQIQNVVLGQIPDGTVTMDKLSTTLADLINGHTTQLADTMHIVGARLEEETNDNGRIIRALNASIGGTCKIPSGTYYIDPATGATGADRGIVVPSNVNILMEQGTILKALPQSSGYYSILTVTNVENVTITGGQIIGERYEHTPTTGNTTENHGMGINILHSKNIIIDNVTIKDCWGDCIYIGGNNFGVNSAVVPERIVIKNCLLENSRRQGISVALVNGLIVENCRIMNINGIEPQYGIDIETNDSAKPCKNTIIKNCFFSGSVGGGFVIGNSAENTSLENCIFDGNNVNINKSKNTKVSNSTFLSTRVSVRSSLGVIITGNILTNSYVDISTSALITENTSIISNIFQNKDGDTSRMGIAVTGTSNGCYGLNISSNSFIDYVAETIYMYTMTLNTVITNNLFKTKNFNRWVLYLRGYDMKVSGNQVVADITVPISLNSLINLTGVRGSFDNNTINVKNIALSQIIDAGTITGDTTGMTISNNVIKKDTTGKAIKFNSTSDTKYTVINNDFRFTDSPFTNAAGHFFYGNITSTTVSQ